ncbi:MAG TPA: S-layer homology domain-containing protein [Epulopiscium sp.]|nr:S-layer homology domain-containing protein [Candidatus Epulonipiscium sp.]
MHKKITSIIALATCFVMIATTTLFASPMKDVSTMKDVSSSHWAYREITEMQKQGLLLPSSQGEFYPNNYVSYFDFSKVLAKATGYKDAAIDPNIDPALKQAIKDNYEKQKATIEAHQKNYQYWQKDANQEIAYLLGKGYFTKEDLGKFMSKSTSGVESKRGVRKQEVAIYLVRMLHIEKTVKEEYVTTGFKDQASINADARPHVAYLRKKNIVGGSSDGNFGPTEPITRAMLSKMLIQTLELKKELDKPVTPTPPVIPAVPETPQVPTDKGLEGQVTKMISKGDGGYYIVLEIEPTKVHTYSIESTASVVSENGTPLSLTVLKDQIDAKGSKGLDVTVKVNLIGTTEYITHVKLSDGIENIVPPIDERPEDIEDVDITEVVGSIYSILMAPTPEVTIQLSNGRQVVYEITPNTQVYSNLVRRNISLWELRLNQQVELEVANKEIKRLDITKAAPPITLTGTILKTSTNGDTIDLQVHYDIITQQSNVVRTVYVPMITQITDGTIQRGRKDLVENMQVVVVFGENGSLEPEQIVILGK